MIIDGILGGSGGGSEALPAQYEESTALHNHAVGENIWLNGRVYEVTAAITAGQAIIINTNVKDAELPANTVIGLQDKPGIPGTTNFNFDESFTVADNGDGDFNIGRNSAIVPSQDELGTVELGDIALYGHAKGETFIWKGEFVVATAAIQATDTIAKSGSGANVASTTVSAILAQLNQNLADRIPNPLPTKYVVRVPTSQQFDYYWGYSFIVPIPWYMQSSKCTLTLTKADTVTTSSTSNDVTTKTYLIGGGTQTSLKTIDGLSFISGGGGTGRCSAADVGEIKSIVLTFSVTWS